MNLFRQNTDILKILKFKLLASYVFLFLQYLAKINHLWINATEPKSLIVDGIFIKLLFFSVPISFFTTDSSRQFTLRSIEEYLNIKSIVPNTRFQWSEITINR